MNGPFFMFGRSNVAGTAVEQIFGVCHRIVVRSDPFAQHAGFAEAVALVFTVAFDKQRVTVRRDSDVQPQICQMRKPIGQMGGDKYGEVINTLYDFLGVQVSIFFLQDEGSW